MSLLMDALKKAELAKRRGQDDGSRGLPAMPAPDQGLALEPIPEASEPGAANGSPATDLPSLPAHPAPIDAHILAKPKSAAARLRVPPRAAADPAIAAKAAPRGSAEARRMPTQAGGANGKTTAQNLFAAKHADQPAARKSFALAIGAFTVLSVGAIAGYFWWQLQPKHSLVANRSAAAPAAAVTAPGAVPPAPTFAPLPVVAHSAAASPAAAEDEDDERDIAPLAAKLPAAPRRIVPVPTTQAAPESPIRVTRTPLQVNPALVRGFDAVNRGDLAAAQAEYESVQKSDPRNSDALHGLAAVAVRQHHLDRAEQLYRQLAEANPQDTIAVAALINLRGQIDPNAAESRLKTLAAEQPDLAAPHFSLGNLYARHGRWNEAQQAYFRAYNAEPDNPDILYNLAISLEHLRQTKLAAQYYGQAIAAAQNRPAGFDKTQAAARLQTLQP